MLTPAWEFGAGGQSSGRQLVTGNLGLGIRRPGVQDVTKKISWKWLEKARPVHRTGTQSQGWTRAGVSKQGNYGFKIQEKGQL